MDTNLLMSELTTEGDFAVKAERSGIRHSAGVSWDEVTSLVTNRPDLVELGPVQEHQPVDLGDREERVCRSSAVERIRQVRIQVGELGADDFVYTVTRQRGEAYDQGKVPWYEVLAGGPEWPDPWVRLSYGMAYLDWAKAMEDEAFEFLASLAKGCARKVRHSLQFAAGMAHPFAPHGQRRRAWAPALRGLGYRGSLGRITRSMRTATVKAAMTLGWEPSSPMPERWKGLPEGVVEIAL